MQGLAVPGLKSQALGWAVGDDMQGGRARAVSALAEAASRCTQGPGCCGRWLGFGYSWGRSHFPPRVTGLKGLE